MKGFGKAVGRLPHHLASAAGYAENSNDEEFDKLNDRLNAFYTSLKKLFDDAKKFKDSLVMILDHQAGFFETLVLILSTRPELSSADIQQQALRIGNIASDIELNLKNVQNELKPELEIIETRVILPCHEVMLLVENARKLVVKRNHKKTDFDRHSDSHKKLTTQERNVSDEKKLGSVESLLDLATREYTNLNALLKQQIPVLLTLKPSLVDPWFQTLYHYQVKVQLRLYQVFYQIVETNFDTHKTAKQVHDASIEVCAAKLAELTVTRKRHSQQLVVDPDLPPVALGAAPPQYSSYGSSSYQNKAQPSSLRTTVKPGQSSQPPNDTQTVDQSNASPPQSFSDMHKNATPAQLPMKLPARTQTPGSYVIALYDFHGETPGDLSFERDDKIQVTLRTPSVNDWWTGILNGRSGVFPGNYVADI